MSLVKALSLFSGGLDSICATRLVMEQGIEVLAVKFVSSAKLTVVIELPLANNRQ